VNANPLLAIERFDHPALFNLFKKTRVNEIGGCEILHSPVKSYLARVPVSLATQGKDSVTLGLT
jgi:hypothetical protein